MAFDYQRWHTPKHKVNERLIARALRYHHDLQDQLHRNRSIKRWHQSLFFRLREVRISKVHNWDSPPPSFR